MTRAAFHAAWDRLIRNKKAPTAVYGAYEPDPELLAKYLDYRRNCDYVSSAPENDVIRLRALRLLLAHLTVEQAEGYLRYQRFRQVVGPRIYSFSDMALYCSKKLADGTTTGARYGCIVPSHHWGTLAHDDIQLAKLLLLRADEGRFREITQWSTLF